MCLGMYSCHVMIFSHQCTITSSPIAPKYLTPGDQSALAPLPTPREHHERLNTIDTPAPRKNASSCLTGPSHEAAPMTPRLHGSWWHIASFSQAREGGGSRPTMKERTHCPLYTKLALSSRSSAL